MPLKYNVIIKGDDGFIHESVVDGDSWGEVLRKTNTLLTNLERTTIESLRVFALEEVTSHEVNLDIKQNFEANQKDLSLDDTKAVWCAGYVSLMSEDGKRQLAFVTGDDRTVSKLKAWCVKNHFRCSAIDNNRIHIIH